MGKILLWIGGFFLPFGLLFAGIGAWSWSSDQALADIGTSTTGTVIALDRRYDSDSGSTYRPVVEFYDANGTRHEFIGDVGSSPAAYSRGETVDVIYDPAGPGRAMVDSFTDRYLLPLAFGGMGSLFAAVGAVMIAFYVRRRKIIAWLKESGVPISAKFVECYRDTSTKVNGRSPWRVVGQATHPTTGKQTSFKSEHIWVDLTEELQGGDVRVLVDPANAKHHYVDLSEHIAGDD